MAPQVELEQAQHGRWANARQPVVAAGEVARANGEFGNHRRDRERQHHQRQAGCVQDQKAADGARYACDRYGRGEARERIAPDMDGKNSGRVGADSVKCAVPQRDNAAMAQRQADFIGDGSKLFIVPVRVSGRAAATTRG